MKKRDIQDIIECRKWSFENGEKKQFSGCLNHWINTSDEYSISWTFLYKQPVTYLVELLGDVRHSMTRRQQVLACIKQRLYKMPFYAYGQRITAWNVFSPINSPTWKENCPILIEQYGKKYDKYPILVDYNVNRILSAEKVWLILSEWLGKQITRQEPVVPVGDDKIRIQAAGFDLKTSFRHRKLKR